LGDVLRRTDRFERRYDDIEYPFAGTYSFARGIFVRPRRLGSTFGLPKIQRIKEGDFVYCKIMAWEGAFGVVPKEADGCVLSGAFVVYEVDRKRVDIDFLDFFVKVSSNWQKIGSRSSGTNVRRQSLHPEQFEKVEVLLPSLKEQQRIAERLREVVAKIDEARALRNDARSETHALLESSLSKAILSTRSKFVTLETVCEQITDGEHATPDRVLARAIPLATAKNVRDGYLDFRITDFVSDETAEKCWRRCRPQHDDVLMICVGATIGRLCRLEQPPKIVLVRSVALLRPDQRVIEPRFLENVLRSSGLQSQIWAGVKQAAQPCLYINRMKQLVIPLPTIGEQRRNVERLLRLQEKLKNIATIQLETSAGLDALMPSILDKALKGTL